MKDITIDYDNCVINIRVGAIIKKNNFVLLCRTINDNFWFLPGGRVKTMESSKSAIIRELNEEIGEKYKFEDYYIFSENFFIHKDRKFHEYCTYFNVSWNNNIENSFINGKEEFKWFEIKRLSEIVVKPTFIVKFIQNKNKENCFISHNEIE